MRVNSPQEHLLSHKTSKEKLAIVNGYMKGKLVWEKNAAIRDMYAAVIIEFHTHLVYIPPMFSGFVGDYKMTTGGYKYEKRLPNSKYRRSQYGHSVLRDIVKALVFDKTGKILWCSNARVSSDYLLLVCAIVDIDVYTSLKGHRQAAKDVLFVEKKTQARSAVTQVQSRFNVLLRELATLTEVSSELMKVEKNITAESKRMKAMVKGFTSVSAGAKLVDEFRVIADSFASGEKFQDMQKLLERHILMNKDTYPPTNDDVYLIDENPIREQDETVFDQRSLAEITAKVLKGGAIKKSRFKGFAEDRLPAFPAGSKSNNPKHSDQLDSLNYEISQVVLKNGDMPMDLIQRMLSTFWCFDPSAASLVRNEAMYSKATKVDQANLATFLKSDMAISLGYKPRSQLQKFNMPIYDQEDEDEDSLQKFHAKVRRPHVYSTSSSRDQPASSSVRPNRAAQDDLVMQEGGQPVPEGRETTKIQMLATDQNILDGRAENMTSKLRVAGNQKMSLLLFEASNQTATTDFINVLKMKFLSSLLARMPVLMSVQQKKSRRLALTPAEIIVMFNHHGTDMIENYRESIGDRSIALMSGLSMACHVFLQESMKNNDIRMQVAHRYFQLLEVSATFFTKQRYLNNASSKEARALAELSRCAVYSYSFIDIGTNICKHEACYALINHCCSFGINCFGSVGEPAAQEFDTTSIKSMGMQTEALTNAMELGGGTRLDQQHEEFQSLLSRYLMMNLQSLEGLISPNPASSITDRLAYTTTIRLRVPEELMTMRDSLICSPCTLYIIAALSCEISALVMSIEKDWTAATQTPEAAASAATDSARVSRLIVMSISIINRTITKASLEEIIANTSFMVGEEYMLRCSVSGVGSMSSLLRGLASSIAGLQIDKDGAVSYWVFVKLLLGPRLCDRYAVVSEISKLFKDYDEKSKAPDSWSLSIEQVRAVLLGGARSDLPLPAMTNWRSLWQKLGEKKTSITARQFSEAVGRPKSALPTEESKADHELFLHTYVRKYSKSQPIDSIAEHGVEPRIVTSIMYEGVAQMLMKRVTRKI